MPRRLKAPRTPARPSQAESARASHAGVKLTRRLGSISSGDLIRRRPLESILLGDRLGRLNHGWFWWRPWWAVGPPSLPPSFLPTLSQKNQDAHSKRLRAREALRGLKGGLGGGRRGGREADRIIVRSERAADRDVRDRDVQQTGTRARACPRACWRLGVHDWLCGPGAGAAAP